MRELVKIVTIDSIEPIPGADKIEAAKVGGWTVVVQKGLYEPGDRAVYFEIDSCLPLSDSRFEHLRARGVKEHEGKEFHRLKTIKLRGVVSQGMLMPLGEFAGEWLVDALDVEDLSSQLGIFKYDDIDPVTTRNASAIGSFPSHVVRKTDSERIQNLSAAWQDILAHDSWDATEKVDGSSLTVARVGTEIKVCSRNWEVSKNEGVYGAMYQKYRDIFDALKDGWAIQAEIAGPGIQSNRLGLTEQRIFIFNVTNHGSYIPRYSPALDGLPQDLFVPLLDLRLPATIEEAIDQVDGLTSVVSPGRLAEGVVWQATNGKPMTVLGDRANFKVISNKYLLKEK